MKELRFFVVEGVGDTRRLFLKQLADSGVDIVRGIPHRSGDHSDLIPEAQSLLAGFDLNPDNCSQIPLDHSTTFIKNVFRATKLQFKYGLEKVAEPHLLADNGIITALDGWFPRLRAKAELFANLSMRTQNEDFAKLAFEMMSLSDRNEATAGIKGIVFVGEATKGNTWEDKLEQLENKFLLRAVDDIQKSQNVDVLAITPEEVTSGIGVDRFYRFAGGRKTNFVV